MPIKFRCPHCQKALSVKDELAGRKGPCPNCRKLVTAPAASEGPAPKPAAPADVEAAAAAALADEPAAAAAEPKTVDFNCPNCDAQLSLPLDLAGKRAQCPECKRIIKVPEPAKKDTTNWRKKEMLPTAARRPEAAPPEGAWGSTAAAAVVSREALREAGAVPDKRRRRPLTRGQWVFRGVLAALALALAAGGAVYAWVWWSHSREDQLFADAVAYADSDDAKSKLGRDGRAALYALAAEYTIHGKRPKSAPESRKLLEKGINAALSGAEGGASERDAVLIDLAAAAAELGGSDQEADDGARLKWDDAQKLVRSALNDVKDEAARLDGLRRVGRRLAARDQGERAWTLAAQLFPNPAEKKAEALGVVGLELLGAKQQAQAQKVYDQITPLYPKDKPPPLAPAAVALAVALGKEPPRPATKEEKADGEKKTVDADPKDAARLHAGRAEGEARRGRWAEARAEADKLESNEDKLAALCGLAAAALDDPAGGAADAEAAVRLVRAGGDWAKSGWTVLRLVRLGAKAGLAEDSLLAVAGAGGDAALTGRGRLAVVEAQLAKSKQAAPPSAADAVGEQTLSRNLAAAALARHNARYDANTASAVRGWEPPRQAFGLVGAALGLQGGE